MITLHHGWRSSASRRVRLVLAEKGLDYESRLVDMVRGDQHSPEYLALNPNGVVPTLVHDGHVLYESSVIAEYLDESFPEPPLLPAEPFERAELRNFVRWIDEHCLPQLIVFNWSISMQPVASQWSEAQLAERLARVPSAGRREAWTRVARKPYTDEEKAAAMRQLLALPERMARWLEERGGPWLMGERYTLADIAAVPFVMRIGELQPGALAAWPGVQRWWAAAQARPAFAQARIEPFADSLQGQGAMAEFRTAPRPIGRPTPPAAALPLSRYTVLDLSIARAGPVAVRLLADWGADVIRIEPPPGGERGSIGSRRHGSDEQNLHRNKRSLCLDLKSEAGAGLLRRLVARADVVVENFRADVKQRLGLDYERLQALNPRIILASISGFGQDGPYRDRPGVDQIVQGLSGLMSVTGERDGPPMRVGMAVSDTSAGLFLGQGILLALLQREHTGRGQWVHTSLLEGMLNKLDFQAARYTMDGQVPPREGNSHPTLAPMGTFEAADGWVNIAASTPRMWQQLCQGLDAQALLDDERYRDAAGRFTHRRELEADVQRHTRRFATAELVARLNPLGVPCGPVFDIGQAFEDEQARHLRMTRPAEHPVLGTLQLLRSPINLSACPHPPAFASAAPDAGEHSVELLRELGCDDTEIETLRRDGVVA